MSLAKSISVFAISILVAATLISFLKVSDFSNIFLGFSEEFEKVEH